MDWREPRLSEARQSVSTQQPGPAGGRHTRTVVLCAVRCASEGVWPQQSGDGARLQGQQDAESHLRRQQQEVLAGAAVSLTAWHYLIAASAKLNSE
jgi:hypothetical protein